MGEPFLAMQPAPGIPEGRLFDRYTKRKMLQRQSWALPQPGSEFFHHVPSDFQPVHKVFFFGEGRWFDHDPVFHRAAGKVTGKNVLLVEEGLGLVVVTDPDDKKISIDAKGDVSPAEIADSAEQALFVVIGPTTDG